MERASTDACLADISFTPACGPCSVDLSDSPDLGASHFQVLGVMYGACPKNETCAFSEGLTHHCTVAGGVGYKKILSWPPWKEPLPRRSCLTTPVYLPVGPVLWTSQLTPILEPVFFRLLGLQFCNAKALVLHNRSFDEGCPKSCFPHRGLHRGIFHVVIGMVRVPKMRHARFLKD